MDIFWKTHFSVVLKRNSKFDSFCLSFRFRLTAPAKSVHWGVPWDVPDDSMLLVGIFEYGLGSWEAIKADQSLSLSSKVRPLISTLQLFFSLVSRHCF